MPLTRISTRDAAGAEEEPDDAAAGAALRFSAEAEEPDEAAGAEQAHVSAAELLFWPEAARAHVSAAEPADTLVNGTALAGNQVNWTAAAPRARVSEERRKRW